MTEVRSAAFLRGVVIKWHVDDEIACKNGQNDFLDYLCIKKGAKIPIVVNSNSEQ